MTPQISSNYMKYLDNISKRHFGMIPAQLKMESSLIELVEAPGTVSQDGWVKDIFPFWVQSKEFQMAGKPTSEELEQKASE